MREPPERSVPANHLGFAPAIKRKEGEQETPATKQQERTWFGSGGVRVQRSAYQTGITCGSENISDEIGFAGAGRKFIKARGSQPGRRDIKRNRTRERAAAAWATGITDECVIEVSKAVEVKTSYGSAKQGPTGGHIGGINCRVPDYVESERTGESGPDEPIARTEAYV